MENIFDNYKGVILFYLVIVILSFIFAYRMDTLNKVSDNTPRSTSVANA